MSQDPMAALRWMNLEPEPATWLRPLWDKMEAEQHRPMAGTAAFRASDALDCARSLGLSYLHRGKERPSERHTHLHAAFVGTVLHEAWQEALEEVMADKVLLEQALLHPSGLVAGHADTVLYDADRDAVEVVDLKTRDQWGYLRDLRDGPKMSAFTQGGFYADMVGARFVTIVAMPVRLPRLDTLKKRGHDPELWSGAQWTIGEDMWRPLVEAELARFQGIQDLVDSGTLPARTDPELPRGAVITDPAHEGRAEYTLPSGKTGEYWRCHGPHWGCPWLKVCAQQPSEEHPHGEGGA